jgi:prepilin-type N-terminal cleavage/methylation domain-containing protein
MCIKFAPRAKRGWTLVEMLVAVGIFSLMSMALMGTYIFSVKSMAAMYNYAALDQYNRQAMDQLTREIRQSLKVLDYNTNSITILTARDDGTAGPTVTYSFSPTTKKLLRLSSEGNRLLLTNCCLLSFQLFTRCPTNPTLESITNEFPVATSNWTNTVKVLRLTWKTAIQLPSGPINSENIQTAQVVIRKQQDI